MSLTSLADRECSDMRGLNCLNGSCQCSNPYTSYWDSKADICMPRLTNGSQCLITGACLVTKGLECATGVCQCSNINFK